MGIFVVVNVCGYRLSMCMVIGIHADIVQPSADVFIDVISCRKMNRPARYLIIQSHGE